MKKQKQQQKWRSEGKMLTFMCISEYKPNRHK